MVEEQQRTRDGGGTDELHCVETHWDMAATKWQGEENGAREGGRPRGRENRVMSKESC